MADGSDTAPQDEKLRLAGQLFLLGCSDAACPNKAEIRAGVLASIKENKMAPFFAEVQGQLLPRDDALVTALRAQNAERVAELDAQFADAVENAGETEEREAKLAKAQYLDSIGERAAALAAYDEADRAGKGAPVAQRIESALAAVRIGLAYMDRPLVESGVERAKRMVEEGGDWEKRNRLKVYEATALMARRQFKPAATLFLDSIATFTTYELYDYKTFILYTVLCGVLTLDRSTLKKRVVNSPEVLAVVDEIPHLHQLLSAYYHCKYSEFFAAFAEIVEQLKVDRYLCPHVQFFEREMCLVAYSQFLQSYKTVTLQSMAASFGVGVAFLDTELARFIALGRLNAKIDKVTGIVETNRPDSKNALYQDAIKQGDTLLNRVQKLSRIVNV